jgi:hypothetical protein
MAITTSFNNGVFEATDGDRIKVYQPFKPTPTGEQLPWANEAEANAWWSRKCQRLQYKE